ncbi:MAG: hypothetical protein MK106_08530 [Mariniblastus sp.]|nr:hypothetical protein [Mariniblastus sp.]
MKPIKKPFSEPSNALPSFSTWVLAFCALTIVTVLSSSGCLPGSPTDPNAIQSWGRRGLGDGRFQKPRAVTIDANQQLYVVDMTGRIQVFDTTGTLLRQWRTPAVKNGKPCGLSMSNDQKLIVSDTHYHRVLFYELDGTLIESRTIGGQHGRGPEEFGFVTDTVQDSEGNYYVAEYGDYDRIQKFNSTGEYLYEWGGHGSKVGEFLRPQGLAIDANDHLWVADASNHRIQVFDATGESPKIMHVFGEPGKASGQLNYPYDLFFDGKGHVFVCEFGNHRIQKFTLAGSPLGTWGKPGRKLGELHQPWGMCQDAKGMIHVLDSYNHRVQQFYWNDKMSTDGSWN